MVKKKNVSIIISIGEEEQDQLDNTAKSCAAEVFSKVPQRLNKQRAQQHNQNHSGCLHKKQGIYYLA